MSSLENGRRASTVSRVDAWPATVQRVADVLRERGVHARLEEFEDGTPTARDAARAVGCELDQIVKSLVFICDGLPVLALLPGDKRADADKVAAAAGSRYARVARPEEVVSATGFEPGAVAPFPAPGVAIVLLDRALLRQELVWCGAGSERHKLGIAPAEVARVTQAVPADLAEG
jgi:prolyl-tRNA editing enzyme YbaK/EbsC (Cys-tRNA(Pro) deacylase)